MVQLLSANSGSILIHGGNGDDGEWRYEREQELGLFIRSGTILDYVGISITFEGRKNSRSEVPV